MSYVELPIGYDGLAVLANPRNDWANHLTTTELKKIWEPAAEGKITRWDQVREGWPAKELHLFGAGADSGTYDYFTEAIVHASDSSRKDYTASEDDTTIVAEIAADPLALGFLGFAYYSENRAKLKLLAIGDGNASNGDGPVAPSKETVRKGTYQPLSRPLFIYVSESALQRPEVARPSVASTWPVLRESWTRPRTCRCRSRRTTSPGLGCNRGESGPSSARASLT